MYFKTGNGSQCSGCFACIDACPVNAVSKVMKGDGFLYPEINNDKCVHCRKCEKVCPSDMSRSDFAASKDCLAGVIRDQDAFFASSSGGAFEAVVRSIKDVYPSREIYVAGAVWGEDFKVIHTVVKYEGPHSLRPLNKSKYVQSDTSGIYRRIKDLLDCENTEVVFSGTPCQAAALRSFLGKNPASLWSVDLICKGAPSQLFFDSYRSGLERAAGAKLKEYSFRNKRILDNGTLYTRSAYYAFDNGISRTVTRFNDDFLKAFYHKEYQQRPSCLCCEYRSAERASDVTIGDAWGIDKKYSELNPVQGVSVILFNTDKSLRLRGSIEEYMQVYDCDLAFIAENNSALSGGGKTLA